MAGFSSITGDEDVMFADNASFDGTERGGKLTLNGQLWIGSSLSPHVRKGTISAGTNMNVINGAGTISIATVASPSFSSVTIFNAPVFPTDATNKAYVDSVTSGHVVSLTGNDGIPVTPDVGGNIFVVGTGSITTVGTTNTETIELTGLTLHNVLIGSGSPTITNVAPSATVGIALVSNGVSADPSFSTVVVEGGGTGAITLTGLLTGTGTTPVVGTPITQYNVITAGAGNLPNSVAPSATSGVALISQGSSAQPIFGTVSPAGGGSGTTSITGVITGNGTSPYTSSAVTNHAVLVGAASNLITSVGPGSTSGVPLIAQGIGSDPVFGTATVPGGGTGTTTLTGLVTGNGTSPLTATPITQFNVITGAVSNTPNSVPPTATSGVPLISQGAASQPIFGTATVAGGGTGSTSFNINGVVISGATTTTPLTSLTLTNGQIVIGGTGAPAAATITAGTGISIVNGNNSITVSSTAVTSIARTFLLMGC